MHLANVTVETLPDLPTSANHLLGSLSSLPDAPKPRSTPSPRVKFQSSHLQHPTSSKMSYESTPEPLQRSPKRTRLSPPEPTPAQYSGAVDGAAHGNLQYAFEDDVGSDADHSFHTPPEELVDEVDVERLRLEERPTRLNYVPYMTLRGHKRGVAQVRYSPDGRWLASCCTCGPAPDTVRER